MSLRRLTVIALLILAFMATFPAHAQDETCTGEDCPVEVADAGDQVHYGLSAEAIAAYTAPVFDQLTVNRYLLYDRRYARITGTINVYDTPSGSVVRTLDAGFNFVTVIEENDQGWTRINAGEWVQTANLEDSNGVISWFTGIFLPE